MRIGEFIPTNYTPKRYVCKSNEKMCHKKKGGEGDIVFFLKIEYTLLETWRERDRRKKIIR